MRRLIALLSILLLLTFPALANEEGELDLAPSPTPEATAVPSLPPMASEPLETTLPIRADCAAALLAEQDSGQVIFAMKSGAFTYVAHPELLNYVGDEGIYEREMRRLCRAAAETDTPLEINFLGIRDRRHYPKRRFWKWAGECGCRVVFGFDAHDVPSAYDGESLKVAEEWVSEFGLRLDTDPRIRSLEKKAE